ncbi:unnamed protein product [Mytilus edulis]|uniref:DUF7869 domain-containing protein n=1 Tax=Mytilus edulis TaxID=6550 RepID=A0A8S3T6P9_MYTED|nr:unnamed protein product [Mytilus edulis]
MRILTPVFSKIVDSLRRNDAEKIPELLDLLPNPSNLIWQYDIRNWLQPFIADVRKHIKPLHYRFTMDEVSNKIKLCYKSNHAGPWKISTSGMFMFNDKGEVELPKGVPKHNYSKDMNISSPIKSQKLRLWLSFVAGVLANALLGPSEIFYIYANELQVIFNVNKKQEVHSQTDYTNILHEDDNPEPNVSSLNEHSKDVILKKTFMQIIKDPNYQLLAWLSTLAFATGSVLKTNLTVLSQVSGLSSFDSYIFIYVPVFSSIGGIVVGLLSDKLRDSLTRLPFLLVVCVLQTLCSFINIFLVKNKALIVLSAFLTGTALGSSYALVSSVVSEMFHIDNYNRNYGMIKGAHAVTALLLQYLFGVFYDANVSDSELFCRGLHCTEMGYTMNTIISLLPVLLCVCLLIRTPLKITK